MHYNTSYEHKVCVLCCCCCSNVPHCIFTFECLIFTVECRIFTLECLIFTHECPIFTTFSVAAKIAAAPYNAAAAEALQCMNNVFFSCAVSRHGWQETKGNHVQFLFTKAHGLIDRD